MHSARPNLRYAELLIDRVPEVQTEDLINVTIFRTMIDIADVGRKAGGDHKTAKLK